MAVGRRGDLSGAVERQAAKAASGGGIEFFGWTDGESKNLRFFTDSDEIVIVYVHERVDCPDGKRRTFVCRKELEGVDECPLCDAGWYRREMGYGIAVLREEVQEGGKVVGYKDVTVETQVDGKTVVQPFMGIVNQAIGNFWHYVDAVYKKYGSLLNYDVEIVRRGASTDTKYTVFPNPPVEIENFKERYAKFAPDLDGLLERLASEKFYNERWKGQKPEGEDDDERTNTEVQADSVREALDEESEFERLAKVQAEAKAEAQGSNPY